MLNNKIQLIADAIEKMTAVNIAYTAMGGERTVRTVFPLSYHRAEAGVLAFGAWCTLRKAYRTFLVASVTSMTPDPTRNHGACYTVVGWVVACRSPAVCVAQVAIREALHSKRKESLGRARDAAWRATDAELARKKREVAALERRSIVRAGNYTHVVSYVHGDFVILECGGMAERVFVTPYVGLKSAVDCPHPKCAHADFDGWG